MTIKKVLDKGHVSLVDFMGSDESVARIARQSTLSQKTNVKPLIKHLILNGHLTPFEFVQFIFHVRCPIFVARQWMRHRTGTFLERSGRYTEFTEDDDFYFPDRVSEEQRELMAMTSVSMLGIYKGLRENNVTKEVARLVLPLNLYTEFYWRTDLRNLIHFLELRLDKHAQYEMRAYAVAVLNILNGIKEIEVSMRYFMANSLKY